jgi:hypothetical protein
MSDDIVKRLRAPSEVTTGWCHIALHHDAAAEIERLRARVEVLEDHLRRMIELDGTWNEVHAAIDAARAALEAKL